MENAWQQTKQFCWGQDAGICPKWSLTERKCCVPALHLLLCEPSDRLKLIHLALQESIKQLLLHYFLTDPKQNLFGFITKQHFGLPMFCNTGERHVHNMLSLYSCFYGSFPIAYYSKTSSTQKLVWLIALCCFYLISPFSVTFIPMGFLNIALLRVPVSLIFILNATITAASLWPFTYWKGEWRPETDRCYKVW